METRAEDQYHRQSKTNVSVLLDCEMEQVLLARLGVEPAEPFDWGNETSLIIASTKTRNTPLTGLDSLMIEDTMNGKNDVHERQILATLFRGAKIDLFTTLNNSSYSITKQSEDNNHQKNILPDEMMDVSIKGLSDRAVAELNVESRTSLFGSILRLFDVPHNEEISGEWNIDKKINNVGDEVAGNEDTTATTKSADGSDTSHIDAAAGPAPIPAIAEEILKEPILSTAEIVRTVHLAARPGDIPAGFDSKEYTMAVLRFLSSDIPYLHEKEAEYRNKEDGSSQEGWHQLRMTLPILPLIKATNPEVSLEQRYYGRVRPLVKLGQKERKQLPEAMDQDEEFRRKVLNLELIFSSSLPFSPPSMQTRLSSKLSSGSTQCPTSSQPTESITSKAETIEQKASGNDLRFAFQRFVPRRKLVPIIEGGAKEELTLMISGHMQQPENTPGPKPRLTKSRREALLGGNATAPVKSVSVAASTAGQLKTAPDKRKGVVDSNTTPSKRKHDNSADISLPPNREK